MGNHGTATAPAKGQDRKPSQQRTERFDGRLDVETKALLQEAADIAGSPLTNFVFSAAREKAAGIIERESRLRLDVSSSASFTQVMLADAEPNEKLKGAARRYRNLKE